MGTGLFFYFDNRDLELADRNTISYKFNPKIGYEIHKYPDRYRINMALIELVILVNISMMLSEILRKMI